MRAVYGLAKLVQAQFFLFPILTSPPFTLRYAHAHTSLLLLLSATVFLLCFKPDYNK